MSEPVPHDRPFPPGAFEPYVPAAEWDAAICRLDGCEVGAHMHPIPPDPARDARVAARRAADAHRAGAALEKLLALDTIIGPGLTETERVSIRDGLSRLHHNRHYGVPGVAHLPCTCFDAWADVWPDGAV